ncbi:MAG: hypothetical protein OSB38_43535, partial [Paraburkholderia fungorum]|nr:hypothetical protein [Paraburkholderia fungorum]
PSPRRPGAARDRPAARERSCSCSQRAVDAPHGYAAQGAAGHRSLDPCSALLQYPMLRSLKRLATFPPRPWWLSVVNGTPSTALPIFMI